MRRLEVDMRLVADPSRCEGHGICALVCPGMISLDEWGFPIVAGAISSRRALAAAKRAARCCPENALTIAGGHTEARTAAIVPIGAWGRRSDGEAPQPGRRRAEGSA